MKKIMAIALSLLMTLPMLACSGSSGGTVTTGDASSTDTPALTTGEPAEPAFKLETLTLAGSAISEYKIVYADHPFTNIKDISSLDTEYDFDRLTAEKLRDMIAEMTDVTLECVRDNGKNTDGKVILVGETSDELSKTLGIDKLTKKKYLIAESKGKLVIGGAIYGATWQAVDALKAHIKSGANGASSFDIAAGTNVKEDAALTTIACIGDSITAGTCSTNTAVYRWTETMQRVLWRSAIVYNYGHGGYAMRKDAPYSIFTTTSYQVLTKKYDDYDVYMIMLGTNDAQNNTQWDAEDDAIYKKDYTEFVNKTVKKNPNASLIVMNCPTYFGTGDTGRVRNIDRLNELQSELCNEFVAAGIKAELYDMHSFSAKHMGHSLFPDNLHPNDAGYVVMGKETARIAEKLIETGSIK